MRMNNVPLPEPHHQSAANFNAPDEPFYTADQMHAHAAAVSAADNKALREALDIAINWLHEDRCIFSRLKEVLRESGHE